MHNLNQITRVCFELLKDIKTSIVYTSTINPGGWVPKKALRSVYRREYPRFLRTFTQYVSKKNQSLPLDLINQSIGKHISSFWTLYCHLVPKITRSFGTSWFDLHVFIAIPSILPSNVFANDLIYHCNNSLNYSKMPYCWSSSVWPILSSAHAKRAGDVQKYGLQSLSVQMCRSNKKRPDWI